MRPAPPMEHAASRFEEAVDRNAGRLYLALARMVYEFQLDDTSHYSAVQLSAIAKAKELLQELGS